MAVVSLSTIKNWFKTGLKPTQAQFWDTWDSFRHKGEQIPIGDINGIAAVYDSINSISLLLGTSKIYQTGDLQIFKISTNTNNLIPEAGDLVVGIVGGFFIKAVYLGGDITAIESFNIITQDEIPIIEP